MEVNLLYRTPEIERSIAVAARICYSNLNASQLYNNLNDNEIKKLIAQLLKSGHMSAFEHGSFTFGISNISRACTHQLVRHRLASYNQQSQRYVKFSDDELNIVIPESIHNSEEAAAVFNSAINECKYAYQQMLSLGISAEDARYVLPNATTSNIVVTMNVRELLHFFNLRCCNRAQWEIRELAWDMLRICKQEAPNIFDNAGPSCIRTICPEGKMTCGNPYK